jgi:hypothetical protein
MDVDWLSQWGNYIVSHRTPANWKEYGREGGEMLAKNEWDEFLFYRDPHDLALTPKAVAEKADKLAEQTVDDFRLYGIQMWEQYRDQHHGTSAERKIWVSAFIKAYTETMDAQVDALIPDKLMKNLDLFCTLLSWMRLEMDHGDGRGETYGLRLSGKKKPEPEKPQKPKYRPTRKELYAAAVAFAKRKVQSEWNRFVTRKSDGAGFRSGMLHHEISFRHDEEWDVSDLDRDHFNEIVVDTFQEELGKKALELAPASAWKNSYLICTLYDQMLAQGLVKTKADEHHRGFWRKKSREDYTKGREIAEWKRFETDRIRKDLEKEAKRQEKAASKKGGAKMSGPASSDEALVIVHLSSLDSYTHSAKEAGDESLGDLLADALIVEIKKHQGPVYIVDQGWEPDRSESRPRIRVLNSLQRKVTWIHFDEAEQDWGEFERDVVKILKRDGVQKVVLAGVWFRKDLSSGCVTEAYFILSKHFETRVNDRICGLEEDIDELIEG